MNDASVIYYPILFACVTDQPATHQVVFHITHDPHPFLQILFVDGNLPSANANVADLLAVLGINSVTMRTCGSFDYKSFVDISDTNISAIVANQSRVCFGLIDDIINKGSICGTVLDVLATNWFKQNLDACLLFNSITNARLSVPVSGYTHAVDEKAARFSGVFGCMRNETGDYVFLASEPAGHYARHAIFARDDQFGADTQTWRVTEYTAHVPLMSANNV